ncbi:MAG TPA: efflux RND transporter periplasmic adaptor subunit [Terriglobia bacterium]|nr:efflux RND transporter periplasmic adaptor subunit [Terriglobia bacterium]
MNRPYRCAASLRSGRETQESMIENWKRRLQQFSGLVGLCLVTLICSTACSRTQSVQGKTEPAALTVPVAKAAREDLARDFEIAAEFRPYQKINVYAKVPGYVKSIYVDIGDRVKAGQLLAVLEIPELTADLVRAKAAVRRSQNELKRARGDLQRAQSEHEVSHLQYNRLGEVARTKPDLVAQQEVDDAQGRDRESEARVAAAEAGLAAAEEQLKVDEASVQREQSMWDYSRITAPFNGVVTERFADTGAMLAAGISSEKQALPVVALSENDLLRLDIPVPESVVPRIHIGTPVAIRVPALSKTYQGKVVRFSDMVDPSIRTMITEIDVPNPKLELVPGMYAYANLTLERKPNALAVPVLAIIHAGDETRVLRIDEHNRVEERVVQIGIQTPTKAEILSGLNVNDLVVTGQQAQLQPGQHVQPKLMPVEDFETKGAQ